MTVPFAHDSVQFKQAVSGEVSAQFLVYISSISPERHFGRQYSSYTYRVQMDDVPVFTGTGAPGASTLLQAGDEIIWPPLDANNDPIGTSPLTNGRATLAYPRRSTIPIPILQAYFEEVS